MKTCCQQNIQDTFILDLLFNNVRTGNYPCSYMICFFTAFDNRSKSPEILNTAIGALALEVKKTGGQNTASGADALVSNTRGDNNTANGAFALYLNTIGDNNTAMGVDALYSNSTGNNNIALGFQAGMNHHRQ